MNDAVLTHDEAGVRTILLNRPERLNALDAEMYSAIEAAVKSAPPESVAIVIRGAGESFAAGADVHPYTTMSGSDFGSFIDKTSSAYTAIETSPIPVIAVIIGYALGGGFEIALACDYILAATDAHVGLPEARLGLLPGGGATYRLRRRATRAVTKWLVMTGTHVEAKRALELGLIDQVAERTELDEVTNQLIAQLARASSQAIASVKRLLSSDTDPTELADAEKKFAVAAFLSEDGKEGLTAFVEKRRPTFRRAVSQPSSRLP